MPAAREVEEHPALLHQPQARLVHQPPGLIVERHVHGDHIGAGEEILERQRLLDARGELPGALHGDLRVVAEDAHAERRRGVGHLDADRAETDDPQRAAGKLEADERLLALLDRLVDRLVVAAQRAGERPGLADVARRQEQAREHELLDRVGVGARGVEDGNAAPAQLRDRNVVDARAGAPDRAHGVGNCGAVHVRRAHQNGIRALQARCDLVAVARQALQAAGADVVESQDAVLHGTTCQPWRRWKSFMKATSACTPSSGMAL